jgi:hypothetical protein
MSESSVPRQNRPQRRRPVDGDEPLSEPAWLRPTLLFLLGLLIGTLVIAGTRPLPSSGWHPANGDAASTGNVNCDQVIATAQDLAELARRAASAAQNQDATSLSSLVRELNDTENTLDVDAMSCHR